MQNGLKFTNSIYFSYLVLVPLTNLDFRVCFTTLTDLNNEIIKGVDAKHATHFLFISHFTFIFIILPHHPFTFLISHKKFTPLS
jgi:hypothetical protein